MLFNKWKFSPFTLAYNIQSQCHVLFLSSCFLWFLLLSFFLCYFAFFTLFVWLIVCLSNLCSRIQFQYGRDEEAGISPYHSSILWIPSWVSYNSTQFWHYGPGDRIRFYRLRAQSYTPVPPPEFRCQCQVQVVTCSSNWLAINQRLSKLPPLVWLS